MTNLKGKERKGLLYLITIAVFIAIMSIACKNKPTAAGDFGEEPEVADKSEVLTPTGKLDIDKNKNAQQYDGKKFVSKKYKDAVSGTEFRYEIKIAKLTTQNQGTSLTFTGYKDGSQFSREYIFPGYYQGRGDNYYQANEGGSGVLSYRGGSGTAKVKFYNDASDKGWADFKPSDYNFTLKLALTNQ